MKRNLLFLVLSLVFTGEIFSKDYEVKNNTPNDLRFKLKPKSGLTKFITVEPTTTGNITFDEPVNKLTVAVDLTAEGSCKSFVEFNVNPNDSKIEVQCL